MSQGKQAKVLSEAQIKATTQYLSTTRNGLRDTVIFLLSAHSDESGQRFRWESGHPFRSKTATFSAVRIGGRDRRRWVIG